MIAAALCLAAAGWATARVALPEGRFTLEWMHSIETWPMRLLASAGNVFSYCRHSSPSAPFHSMLGLMP